MQRRRGQKCRVWATKKVIDNRGNETYVFDPDTVISGQGMRVCQAWLTRRTSSRSFTQLARFARKGGSVLSGASVCSRRCVRLRSAV